MVAVVGSSGCGKSSVVKAGLIPAFRGGFRIGGREKWMIASLKPGYRPLQNLVAALLATLQGKTTKNVQDVLKDIREGGIKPLVDLLAQSLALSDENLLILVDQFEELFRFIAHSASQDTRNEGEDFVAALLRIVGEESLPVYLVLTMRSDFIGECDSYFSLPEALNACQYIVPRLTRKELNDAIVGPASMCGGVLAPRLVDKLLNTIGTASDQLPVLEHALLRTWKNWEQRNGSGEIDLNDYEAIGTITNALSIHANEALAGMSQTELASTKELFQALVNVDSSGRTTRRPVRLSEAIALTGASVETMLKIIASFTSDSRTFLTLSSQNPEDDPVIDISHESLIGLWDKLKLWTDEEKDSRVQFERIADAAELHFHEKSSLWVNPQLQLALSWRRKKNPTAEWAVRYGKNYQLAMQFLDKSRTRRVLSNSAKSLGLLLLAVVVVFGLKMYYNVLDSRAETLQKVQEQQTKLIRGWLLYVLNCDSSRIIIWDPRAKLLDVPKWKEIPSTLLASHAITGAVFDGSGKRFLAWDRTGFSWLLDGSTGSVLDSLPVVPEIAFAVDTARVNPKLRYALVPGGRYKFSLSKQWVDIPPIHFARYLVTNGQYRLFIRYLEGGPGSENLRRQLPTERFNATLLEKAKGNEGLLKWVKNDPGKWAKKFRSTYDDDPAYNGEMQPVVGVTWFAAWAYCLWLTALEGDSGKFIFRLPTEEEWEWAASGGTRRYPWGDSLIGHSQANYGRKRGPSPVGAFPKGATPSPQVLMDMAGNVYEWMENPFEPSRALRGGAWTSDKGGVSCTSRISNVPTEGNNNFGFRVVRVRAGF
jgi:formylglycine-generating enzyme required for sulfatase activity